MFQPLWKNMSQNGNLPQIGVTIKNIWNHHPVRIHGIPGLKALLFWRVQASNIDSLDGSETIGFWGPSPFVTSAPQKIRLHKKSREGLRGHESTTPKKRWSKYARVASTYESLDSLMAKVKFFAKSWGVSSKNHFCLHCRISHHWIFPENTKELSANLSFISDSFGTCVLNRWKRTLQFCGFLKEWQTAS